VARTKLKTRAAQTSPLSEEGQTRNYLNLPDTA
jgi:hypothetical protein